MVRWMPCWILLLLISMPVTSGRPIPLPRRRLSSSGLRRPPSASEPPPAPQPNPQPSPPRSRLRPRSRRRRRSPAKPERQSSPGLRRDPGDRPRLGHGRRRRLRLRGGDRPEGAAERPIARPGELLETVPGVIITQHSGSGKANQYFLRGFNLDHGTDFRITVDDIPVNMPSHGHGQGYSDLNFLIPELVDTVRYKKGTYYAEEGDFSAAGAAEFTYVNSLPKGIAEVIPGSTATADCSRPTRKRTATALSSARSRSAATTVPGCTRTTTASSTACCAGPGGTPATASPSPPWATTESGTRPTRSPSVPSPRG